MTEMSPLRRPMVEDMTVRNLSQAAKRSYVNAVAKFGRFFGRSATIAVFDSDVCRRDLPQTTN
jgi:hypothetical protein